MLSLCLSEVSIASLFYFEFFNLQILDLELSGRLLQFQLACFLGAIVSFLSPLSRIAHQLLQLGILDDYFIVGELCSILARPHRY